MFCTPTCPSSEKYLPAPAIDPEFRLQVPESMSHNGSWTSLNVKYELEEDVSFKGFRSLQTLKSWRPSKRWYPPLRGGIQPVFLSLPVCFDAHPPWFLQCLEWLLTG